MKSLSHDTHAHNGADDQELYDFLSKEASDSPGDDEEGTVGVTPDTYPDPEDRKSGDIDAPWGEHDVSSGKEHADAFHNSDQVYAHYKKGREELLQKLFDSKVTSDPAHQKILSQNLEHARTGEFETSSSQLSGKSKMSSIGFETLRERLKSSLL